MSERLEIWIRRRRSGTAIQVLQLYVRQRFTETLPSIVIVGTKDPLQALSPKQEFSFDSSIPKRSYRVDAHFDPFSNFLSPAVYSVNIPTAELLANHVSSSDSLLPRLRLTMRCRRSSAICTGSSGKNGTSSTIFFRGTGFMLCKRPSRESHAKAPTTRPRSSHCRLNTESLPCHRLLHPIRLHLNIHSAHDKAFFKALGKF